MVGSNKISPCLFAALGAASSYYCFSLIRGKGPFFILGLCTGFIFIISVFRALNSLGEFAGKGGYLLRKSGLLFLSFTAGFFLGLGAGAAEPGLPRFGLPPEKITGLYGTLYEDPRFLNDSRGMGSLLVSGVSGDGGIRAFSRPPGGEGESWFPGFRWAGSPLPVFFPQELMPALKDFGRGSEIYTGGVLVRGERGPLFRAQSVAVLKPPPKAEGFRTGFRTELLKKTDSPVWGGLAQALLLGVRDNLDTKLSRDFRDAGCSHILALSGMHLAVFSALIALLLRKPLGIRLAALGGAVFVILYVYLAGAQPSLVRSAIMYLLGCLAIWGSFKTSTMTLLALSFLLQILCFRGSASSPSFILSYLALGGILWTGESLNELFRGKLPRPLASGLSASLGAFIATAAVSLSLFGMLRPIGILAGLAIAPLASFFMILSLAGLASAFFAPPLFTLLDGALSLLYRLLEGIISLAASFPGIETKNPSGALPALLLSLFAAGLICFFEARLLRKRKELAPFD
ncbi:MAG: ComEC/Rec2 family competence protein [Treponema sp.]|jgi:competence protein ComEC|nr:ComEC/Rec2 family competence protein [Treponema sp.]